MDEALAGTLTAVPTAVASPAHRWGAARARITAPWRRWLLAARLGPEDETVIGRATGARC